MGVHEVWMDGAAFRKIADAEAEVDMRRRALEEQKKLLQKSRPKKKRAESTPPCRDGRCGLLRQQNVLKY
jgi:hypothetical protein